VGGGWRSRNWASLFFLLEGFWPLPHWTGDRTELHFLNERKLNDEPRHDLVWRLLYFFCKKSSRPLAREHVTGRQPDRQERTPPRPAPSSSASRRGSPPPPPCLLRGHKYARAASPFPSSPAPPLRRLVPARRREVKPSPLAVTPTLSSPAFRDRCWGASI
jgi:hypothetical protein